MKRKNSVALSVNVNKVALLRNSRGADIPNVIDFCRRVLKLGAHGITVHPRPDGRHIRAHDVVEISRLLKKYPRREFNVEGYPEEKFLRMLEKARPHQATLVPDKPNALTSNAGWALARNRKFLTRAVRRLQIAGIRVSLFVDAFKLNDRELKALLKIGPDRVELYTEKYAKDFLTRRHARTLAVYKKAAKDAASLGIEVNAGHDLNAVNLGPFLRAIPEVREVSIGHALISEALYDGIDRTMRNYARALPK